MGILRAMMVVEAVNSVALEHPSACRCLACRTAEGDSDALAQVMAALAEGERTGRQP